MSGVGAVLYGAPNVGNWLLEDSAGEGELPCQEADYLVSASFTIASEKATHVFSDDFLQCLAQHVPWKHLDILFNIPRLRVGKAHYELEKLFRARLALADRDRPEPFQVSPDPVLFLPRKATPDERFEEVDRIDRRDIAHVGLFAVDTRDDDTAARLLLLFEPFGLRDGVADGSDGRAGLSAPELDETAAVRPFFRRPPTGHVAEVRAEIEGRFGDGAICGGDGDDTGDLGGPLEVGLAERGVHGHGLLVVFQGVRVRCDVFGG